MNPVSQGSGVFVDARGKLVTNHHVLVQNWRSIEVRLASNAYYKIEKIVGDDAAMDAAILQFSAHETPFATLGDSDRVETGARVLAVGTSLGLESSVSEGVVSHPKRVMGGIAFIQFTAPISSGSSGGGLFDPNRNLLGITTRAIAPQPQQSVVTQNLNFAVPSNLIRQALDGQAKQFTVETPNFFYLQGVLAENQKRHDDALAFFTKAIELNAGFVDAYIDLGNVYFQKGDFDG